MTEHDFSNEPNVGMEPEDLAGHSIEELSDYLDAGRTPPDPSIDESPGCLIALDALARLRELTPGLFAADIAAEPQPDENWMQGILSGIALDARAGRRIPISSPFPTADLGITEGAIRGAIRAAESSVPGIVVGKCRFDGDITVPDAATRVHVDVSVLYGEPIVDLAERLRDEVSKRLAVHTSLNVIGVDINVHDVHELPDEIEENR